VSYADGRKAPRELTILHTAELSGPAALIICITYTLVSGIRATMLWCFARTLLRCASTAEGYGYGCCQDRWTLGSGPSGWDSQRRSTAAPLKDKLGPAAFRQSLSTQNHMYARRGAVGLHLDSRRASGTGTGRRISAHSITHGSTLTLRDARGLMS
jgi:hypothetical protein